MTFLRLTFIIHIDDNGVFIHNISEKSAVSAKAGGKLTMTIKILGQGCADCKSLYENTKRVVADRGIDAEVLYVTDLTAIVLYGVMQIPALVIDEKVVSVGRVLKPREIEKLLAEAMQA